MSFILICLTMFWVINPVQLLGKNDIRNEFVTTNIPKFEFNLREQTWDEFMNVLKSRIMLGSGTFNLSDVISAVDISHECRQSLEKFVTSLSAWKSWAVMMHDANWALPSGVLSGRVTSFGSFDQCLAVRGPLFRGQYCLLAMRTPLLSDFYDNQAYARRNQRYEDTYGKPPEWVENFLEQSGPFLKQTPFFLGACVPSTCSGEDVRTIYTHVSEPYGVESIMLNCQVDEQKVWTTQDHVAMSFLVILAVLSIVGTAADITGRCLNGDQQNSPFIHRKLFHLLRVFSVISNAARLLGEREGGEGLACLNGLRVLAFMCVLIGHQGSVLNELKLALYRNSFDMIGGSGGYFRAVIIDGTHVAIDTFFCISGFLLVFSTWKKLEKSGGRFSILKFMLQKYLRLTPSLALTLSLFIVMYKLGSGPFWEARLGPSYRICGTTWWRNFLYIHNLFDGPMCLGHTWFLSVLMQCHLVGVTLLCIVYRWPIHGILLSSFIVGGTFAYIAWMSMLKNYPFPKVFYLKDFDFINDMFTDIHCRTSVNLSSYIFGMGFGYLQLKHKKDFQIKFKVLGWLLSACSTVYVFYGLYCLPETRVITLLYHVSHRALFVACLGWLIHSCCISVEGWVNRFLSWQGFAFLGKISFQAYLLHNLLMLLINYSKREAITYGQLDLTLEILGLTAATFIVSIVAYVAVELPLGKITTHIFLMWNFSEAPSRTQLASVKGL